MEHSSDGEQNVEVTVVRTPEVIVVLAPGVLGGYQRIGARLGVKVVRSARKQLAEREIALLEVSWLKAAHQTPAVPALKPLLSR